MYRMAPRPQGPWSAPIPLFVGLPPGHNYNHLGKQHPDLQEEAGRIIYVSYFRPVPSFRGEMRLPRVTFDRATTVNSSEVIKPTSFILEQNYPNPFNTSTVIRFRLPGGSHVNLRVYNLTGQLVRTLVEAQKPAGRHQVVWDGLNARGEHLSSGVYLYRIEAGDFRATKRLTMVK